MLTWSTIAYGAALSAVLAGLAAFGVSRRAAVAMAAFAAGAVAPFGWNAVLRATHARGFFTDAPIAVLPASWQDTGSGVAAFALTAALLGLGPLARDGRRTVVLAGVTGLTAFLVDVYLY